MAWVPGANVESACLTTDLCYILRVLLTHAGSGPDSSVALNCGEVLVLGPARRDGAPEGETAKIHHHSASNDPTHTYTHTTHRTTFSPSPLNTHLTPSSHPPHTQATQFARPRCDLPDTSALAPLPSRRRSRRRTWCPPPTRSQRNASANTDLGTPPISRLAGRETACIAALDLCRAEHDTSWGEGCQPMPSRGSHPPPSLSRAAVYK